MMSKQFRFIHLSDLHFGHDEDHETLHHDVRDQLINDVKEITASLGPPDAVVVTGDIAYSAQVDEYDVAGQWLEDLCAAVNCDTGSVYVVPGNHDVDWTKCKKPVELLHKYIWSADRQDLQKRITELNETEELLPKLENYRVFAARFGSDFDSLREPRWSLKLAQLEFLAVHLWGLNTALYSGPSSSENNEKGVLALGEIQYILPEPEKDELHIVLMHHPLDWMKDSHEARQFLERRAKLWITGHEHTFGIRRVENIPGQSKTVEIEAGATNPPSEDGYEFRYNWIELSDEMDQESVKLKIEIWPRLYTTSTKFQADSNLLKDKSSFKMSLIVQDPPSEDSLEGSDTEDIKEMVQDYPAVVDEDGHQVPEDHVGRNDIRFRRLQFLFWTQITRTQRLDIMIRLSLLPEIMGNHIHNMLRTGLDVARSKGMLHELWNELTELIPQISTEANPFATPEGRENERSN